MKIPLFDLDYGEEEKEAVLKVLESKWLTMGEVTARFEEEFARYVGVNHAVAVSSCTAALHLACLAAGVGPGDEVICPSLTFVATAAAAVYAGGRPVFADVESLDDWTVSPRDVARKVTASTKAIIVVHYGGFVCDMEAITAVAETHHLKIVEDCAHSPGSTRGGRNSGTFGDVACYSFFTNKNLSTGEGGMVCTNDDEMAAQIRLARSHAMTSLTLDRHRGRALSYDVLGLGYNYRLDEMRSALGIEQLKKLDVNNARRIETARRYRERLSCFEWISRPFGRYEGRSNYHIYPLLLDEAVDRAGFMKHLRDRGVQTSIHYPPIHRFTHYRRVLGSGLTLPLTERIGSGEVTLPMHPLMTADDVDYIADAIADWDPA